MSVTTPACPWCARSMAPAGHRLVACPGCGVALTHPAPDAAELDAAYAGSYRPAAGRFSAGGDRLLARTRGSLAGRIVAAAPPGPVLDVGSGDGALLDALAARGRSAVGLERGATGRPTGPERGATSRTAGLEPGTTSRPTVPERGATSRTTGPERGVTGRRDVVAAELTDYDERHGEWAAIVLWHSLEHLPDAPAALDRAAELLAPGGLLILAVPNRDSWQARVLGDRWLALDLPRHLSHLTPRALTPRLRAAGLTVEQVNHWRGGQVLFGWLHGLVVSLPGHPDLYDAIRRPEARARPIPPARRALTLAVAAALAPVAAVLAGAEVLAGHGGSVLVQARKPAEPSVASATVAPSAAGVPSAGGGRSAPPSTDQPRAAHA